MFHVTYPVFEKDMILRAEMLENISSYPRDMLHIIYDDYSDGIIVGAKILVDSRYIKITAGIIKWKGVLYHMEEEFQVRYEANGKEMLLKLKFDQAEQQKVSFHEKVVNCSLVEGREVEANELELCRFTLKTGAVLRKDYQTLLDFSTTHNTINIINVPCAGIEKSTLLPEITKYYGKELMKTELINLYDISFGMLCMQGIRIEREVITTYLNNRLRIRDAFGLTNQQIHGYLVQILEKVKYGERDMGGGFRERKMIVD